MKSQAQIDTYAKPLEKYLGLDEWAIHYSFGRLDEETWEASCGRTLDAKVAYIKFDNHYFMCDQDEERFLDILYHELIHVVLGYMDLVRDCSVVSNADNRVWRYALETTVYIFERTWKSHGKEEFLAWFSRSSLPAPSPDSGSS